jgi:hypothetical protein
MSAVWLAKFFAARTDLMWGKMFVERTPQATARRLGTSSPRPASPPRSGGYGNVERRAVEGLRLVDG